MRGFAGRYTAEVGDKFVFEGGDRWPNSEFPLVATGSGDPRQPDYYGVDESWHAGAGWTRPVFDADGQNVAGVDPRGGGGTQDIVLDLRGHDYITVDDIAFDHFAATGLTGAYGSCAAIEMQGDQHITIDRVSIPRMAVDATTYHGPDCFAVEAATYSPYAGDSIVENSSISGAPDSYATGILCVGNVQNDTIDHMIGEVYPCGHGTISGNDLANCGNPFPAGSSGIHADAIQTDNADGSYYIHDNVIRDTGADQSAPNECETMLIGNPGETDYVYNNVLYNVNGNAISLTQNTAPGVAAYIWNNSIEGGFAGSAYCVRSGHPSRWPTISIENNLCATAAAQVTDPSLSASTLSVGHNVRVTPHQATSPGHGSGTGAHPYQPPTPYAPPTHAAGVNLTQMCGGELSDLCFTTSFAGQLKREPRPRQGPWDAGAY